MHGINPRNGPNYVSARAHAGPGVLHRLASQFVVAAAPVFNYSEVLKEHKQLCGRAMPGKAISSTASCFCTGAQLRT